MSQESIGDQVWAEMTDGQKVEAVLKGHATLKQMSEGLLDGSEQLRTACHDVLAHTASSFENLPISVHQLVAPAEHSPVKTARFQPPERSKDRTASSHVKNRFGLPDGFVPRMQRYGRGVLLELNVYRLPDGREFIPSPPTGTLGARSHLYALLTPEQYLKGQRGSVYVKNDGRVFDYSVDSANSSGDLFDSGYTIYDLERTGRYAPSRQRRKKKKAPAKFQRASAGGAR